MGCLAAWIIQLESVAKVIFFIVGALAGFFIGLFLYTALLALIGTGPAWLMIGFAIVCAIIVAYYSQKYRRTVVMLGTTVIGSYWIVRGLSYFFGNYPNESEIWAALSND